MGNKKNKTVNEHYVPQFYLRNFGIQKNPKDSKSWFIEQYRIANRKKYRVPIRSIGYEKLLYEFTSSSGVILYENEIEHNFSKLEGLFDKELKSILSLVSDNSDYSGNRLLSTDKKATLLLMMAIQILRTPKYLDVTKNTAKEWFDINADSDAKNLVRVLNLPFDDRFWGETSAVKYMITQFLGDCFTIGIYPKPDIMTSDMPVICLEENDRASVAIYPLSPKICLLLRDREHCPISQRNSLVHLTSDDIDRINVGLGLQSEWLYFHPDIDPRRLSKIENEVIPCKH